MVGIDRIMSEGRALTNAIGNSVATLFIARWQGELDMERLQHVLHHPQTVDAEVERAMLGADDDEPRDDRPLRAREAARRHHALEIREALTRSRSAASRCDADWRAGEVPALVALAVAVDVVDDRAVAGERGGPSWKVFDTGGLAVCEPAGSALIFAVIEHGCASRCSRRRPSG